MLGICCPDCDSGNTGVCDSRACQDGIRRRRACKDCGFRFTTTEFIGQPEHEKTLRELYKQVNAGIEVIEQCRKTTLLIGRQMGFVDEKKSLMGKALGLGQRER